MEIFLSSPESYLRCNTVLFSLDVVVVAIECYMITYLVFLLFLVIVVIYYVVLLSDGTAS